MFAYCGNNPINYLDKTGNRYVIATETGGGLASASLANASRLPPKGDPNSSQTILNPDGTPKQKRWYGPDGNAERDRDYNHTGDMPFPHDHIWNGGKRGKEHLQPSPEYKFSIDPPLGAFTIVLYSAGIMFVLLDDATGVGVADDVWLAPLAYEIVDSITKIFK